MSKKHSRHPAHTQGNAPTISGTVQTFSSPYPLPNQITAFEQAAPGSVKDILATAQESIRFQQKIQELAINAQIERDKHMNTTIRWVLFVAIAGGFTLAFLRRDTASYVLLFAELGGLALSFLYGKSKT